jgi:hypothetical protein
LSLKKFHVVASAEKMMITVFCNGDGIILILCTPKGTTMTHNSHLEILHEKF